MASKLNPAVGASAKTSLPPSRQPPAASRRALLSLFLLGSFEASMLAADAGEAGRNGQKSVAPEPAPGTPAAQEPKGPPASPVGAEGAIHLESVSTRGTLPLSLAGSLRLVSEPQGARGLVVGENTIPVADMIFLRFPWQSSPRAPFVLILRKGGELAGKIVGGNENAVRFQCPALRRSSGVGSSAAVDTFEVPLESVRGLLVLGTGEPPAAGSASSAEQLRLRELILAARSQRDQLVLVAGSRVNGILEGLRADAVVFSSEGLDQVAIQYDKIRALVLAELEASPVAAVEPPRTRVTLRDGTFVPGRIEGLDAGVLSLHHPDLGTVSISLEEVLEIAFLGGRSSYLSDLEPVRVKEELGPAFVLRRPFRRDANVLGEPLRMAGREYRKGLGVHSYSLLEFDLGGSYARFLAWIGLDESAQPEDPAAANADAGAVVFRVRLDQKLLLEKAMTWRDLPHQLELPVAGGRLLALEVDYGPKGNINFARDRADWAEAMVVK